ncbi:tetratricopeptide repeat protein, partial [Streptomyces sp. NPDC056323]|uniref:caspase, EACC1-associated type n=1 Tax=Streptomyces sp. NPDC056323 TaxID=3345784 RepID=UPI0035D959DE
MGRRLAMLIATFDYQDSALRQLTAPAHDAKALAAVLKDPDIAGFEVTTLVNQPHYLIGEAIGDFYRDARRDDLTLLYFTGHGLKDDDGRLYLAMTNTRRDRLLFTALAAEQIDQAMEECNSRQKVLILDCCYSGAFPAGRISKSDTAVHALERFRGRGRTVLTASDATQYSFEGNQLHGQAVQSVFTRYLVDGLRDGSADLDGDGDITLDELYGYVYDRVVDEMPQQRPKRQDNVEGRIVIARNVNWALPTYLSNALASPIATDRLAALDGLAHLHRIGNDVVRSSIIKKIHCLADDDSKRVSSAAAVHLRSLVSQSQTSPSEAPPERAPEAAPEQPQPPRSLSLTSEAAARSVTGLEDAVALGRRGEAHRKAGRLDEAVADLTAALDLDPQYSWALAQRGITHRKAGRFDEAIADLTAALDLDPTLSWALAQRGEAHREAGRFDEAIASFTASLDLNPQSAWALASRGMAHRQAGRFDEAIADLTAALDLDPKDAWALAQRGIAHRKAGRFDEAIADLTAAINLDPTLSWALAHRGEAHREAGRFDEAIASFTASLDLNPQSAWAL